MGSVIGYPEAHGAAATFETDVAEKIKSLIIDINPVQEGNGEASSSNIRPITGWTVANITHHGKNMAQYWQQAYIGADGSIKTGSTYAMSKPVFVQNGRPIAVSNTAGDYQGIAVFSDSSLENMIYRLANTASTYTASQDCYVVCWFNKVYSEYTESEFIDRGVQIEFAYSSTAFEPYSHDEYDVTFPSEAGTVYGGKVNAISGELIVDKTIVDLGTLDWSKSNLTYFKSDSLKSVIEVPVGQKTPADMVCSKYATLSYSQVNTGNKNGIAVIGDTSVNDKGLLTINDLALIDSTAEDFKSSLSGTMLVYKMSTPITYSLTPKEIGTIIGTNTIYADTGDVSVLYPKTLTPSETVSNVNLMELRRGIIASQPHLETKTGAIVAFKSTMAREPKSLVVDIEPVQEGTGDPSPDNIRPITGWTGAKVTRTGKNLLVNKKIISGNSIYFGTDVNGSPSDINIHSITLPAGTYTFSVETADGSNTNLYVAKSGVQESFVRVLNTKSATFTLSETTDCRLWAYKNGYSTVGVGAIIQFQIELGSTATAYEPYVGSTYDITFPSEAGTVYGGTLDVVKGELVVDRGYAELSENWYWKMSSTYTGGYYASLSDSLGYKKNMPFACSHAKTAQTLSEYILGTCFCDNSINFRIMSEDSTLQDWKDYIVTQRTNGTPISICFELATPITYQLTPQEIALLCGNNTIFADCGDTTISYFTN